MRDESGEFGFCEKPIGFLTFIFLVFYLTPGRIFVNRLGLPAKFRNLQAAMNWPGHTPE
jgi:hypothetical protein